MSWQVKRKVQQVTCSLVSEPTVFIARRPFTKIGLLMDKYPNQEWLGYMEGQEGENSYMVEDIVIPPHAERSHASAEAEPFHQPERCLGVIHSHNNMGAFHSGTDDSYVDHNYPISITVAKKDATLEFDTLCNKKTECGRWLVLKGKIQILPAKPDFDTEAFMTEATANIEKGDKVYSYPNGGVITRAERDVIYLPSSRPLINGKQFQFYEGDADEDELLEGKDGRKMSKRNVADVVSSIFSRKCKQK